MFHRVMVRCGLVLALVLLFTSAVTAQELGAVKGVVRFNGVALAGVEVFVGIQGETFEARYTCTDANGSFRVDGLPVNTPLIVAAGIEVEFGQLCSNPLLLDTTNPARRQPLVIQTWQNHNGPGVFDPIVLSAPFYQQDVRFDLIEWPTRNDRFLNDLIIRGTRHFQAGRAATAISSFEALKLWADLYRSSGLLSATQAADIRRYADGYIQLFRDLTG